jgi:quercetin dioxygenase-like cupin family protein
MIHDSARLALPLCLVLLAPACAGSGDEAPEAGEPREQVTQRIPQFENERVEVWKSIIMPDQPLTMHRHDNPRAIIALRGGTLTVTNDAGESRDMVWETGSAYWLDADPPGELHGDVNQGTEPVEVIVVQLKSAGGS